jgi:F-type H+-transporting ATPase subunit delta
LAEVVFEENLEPVVTEDLTVYNEIFRQVPGLLESFHSPAVPRDAKEKLLRDLMALHPINSVTSNFLRILLQHNRMFHFPLIYESYLTSVNKRKGIVSAKVATAVPLSAQELKELSDRLSALTGKQVTVELQTDERLLGGVVVQIGDTIFDGSIRTLLYEMRKQLAES